MFGDAADILASGSPVLLDATFLEDKRRADAASIAAARGVPFVLVEAICDDAEVRRRLLERAASGSDPSDAGIAIYVRQRQEVAQSPPSVPEGAVHIVIDTTNPKSAPIESLLGELVRRQIVTPRIPDRALLLHD